MNYLIFYSFVFIILFKEHLYGCFMVLMCVGKLWICVAMKF